MTNKQIKQTKTAKLKWQYFLSKLKLQPLQQAFQTACYYTHFFSLGFFSCGFYLDHSTFYHQLPFLWISLLFWLYLVILGVWRQHSFSIFPLLSAVHLQLPLTSHHLSATCSHFLLCSSTPTSTHVCSCILHLQHHIRPVLFLHSSLIYIPPPHPFPSPSLFFLSLFCTVWVTLSS